MNVEVWVHADGEGPVPPAALERARLALGESCVGVTGLRNRWSVGVRLDADTVEEAMDGAVAQVQAAAAAAGLPDWPVEHVDGTGEAWSVGPFKKQRRVAAGIARATIEGGEGPAGVREPRRPAPDLPSLSAEHPADQ
jgi:hypothetical protein